MTPSSCKPLWLVALSSWWLSLAVSGVAGVLALGAAPPAWAQAQAPSAAAGTRMRELLKQAQTDFAATDYESARIGLREAISVGERAGMARDPLMARLYLALGAVLLTGYQERERADRALAAATQIAPTVEPPEGMSTPELQKALSAARARVRGAPPAPAAGQPPAAAPVPGVPVPAAPAVPPAAPPAGATTPPPVPVPVLPPSGAGPAPGTRAPGVPGAAAAPVADAGAPPSAVSSLPPPVAVPIPPPPGAAAAAAPAAAAPPRRRRRRPGTDPDLPANIPQPLYCPNLDVAPPEEDIVLHCVLGPDLTATRVLLFYRGAGKEKFTSAPTTRSAAGWYRATIPGKEVQPRSLQYYLEARDSTDQPVANAGRDDSPNLVLVKEDAPPLGKLYAGIARARSDDDASANAPEDDDPLAAVNRQRLRERAAAGRHVRQPRSVFLGLHAGSGYGWHPRGKLEFYDASTIDAGWIPSGLFHLLPELGYQLTEKVALSLAGRMQFISQSGSGDDRPGAPASGAFALLGRAQYLAGAGNLQTALSAYAGAGEGFRLTIDPIKGQTLRNDSVRGGPLVAGAGIGLLYHFSEHLAVAVDGKALYGFPTTAAVLDATTGVQVAF